MFRAGFLRSDWEELSELRRWVRSSERAATPWWGWLDGVNSGVGVFLADPERTQVRHLRVITIRVHLKTAKPGEPARPTPEVQPQEQRLLQSTVAA